MASKNKLDIPSKNRFAIASRLASKIASNKHLRDKIEIASKAVSDMGLKNKAEIASKLALKAASKVALKIASKDKVYITPKNKFEAFQDILAYEQIIESLNNNLNGEKISHIAISGIDSRNGSNTISESLVQTLSLSHDNILFIKLYNRPKNVKNGPADIKDVFEEAVRINHKNGSVGISKVELYTEEIPRPTSSKEGSLKEIIENLKNIFDVIVWDLPPADRTVHSRMIAKYTQGVILVVEAGKTRWQKASHIIENFRFSKCNILGVVLNNKKNYIPDWLYALLFRAS